MELPDLEEPFGGSPFSVPVTEVRLPAHWEFWREIGWKLQISHQSSYKMDQFPVEKGSQERARVTMTCTTKVSNTSHMPVEDLPHEVLVYCTVDLILLICCESTSVSINKHMHLKTYTYFRNHFV